MLQKAKPEAAATIKRKCALSLQQDLQKVLDVLLHFSNHIDDDDTIEWCRWLIAGGSTPEEFSAKIRLYDKSTSCRLVWTENFVAYRCRTCGISPFMSLCSECFQHGNHEGHDFIMFRSETGGTCDCGEINVIKESGCCFLHGPAQLCSSRSAQHCMQNNGETAASNSPTTLNNNNNTSMDHSGKPSNSAPPELLFIANGMMPRLFLRLVQHMRSTGFSNQFHHSVKFIKMLQDFTDMGAAMTRVMVLTLTSSQIYKNSAQSGEHGVEVIDDKETYDNLILCLAQRSRNMNPPLISSTTKIQIPVHNTFLDELLFWTTILEFPEDLVTLLLSMRSDSDYKEAFTKAFAMQYRLIPTLILNSGDPDKFCKRMTSISVQLFSIETLAVRMVEQTDLLNFLMDSLGSMIESTRRPDGEIDLKHSIMTNNQYWPIQSDLKELLSHLPVAEKFCQDQDLLRKWIRLISSLHGMNPNVYLSKQEPHVESETDGGVESFTAELGLCATPMWGFISHFQSPSHAKLTTNVITCCWEQVKLLLMCDKTPSQAVPVSFHLPLFRYIAAFIYQGVSTQKIPLETLLLPPGDESGSLFKTVVHELIGLHAVFKQVRNRLWARNGSQMVDQTVFYVDSSCSSSMIDLDLFFVQISLPYIPSEEFWIMSMRQFLVLSVFCPHLESSPREQELDSEEKMKMLESFFIYISTLMTLRTYLGGNYNKSVEIQELSTLLCQSDKTHSQLMELMPSRCSTESQGKNIDSILEDIADFIPPRLEISGSLAQGTYKPKPIVWDTMYNPIHALLRSSNRSDFQASRDRFLDHCKRSRKCQMKEECLWPPFKTPLDVTPGFKNPMEILNSQYFHSIVFIVLHKAVNDMKFPDFITSIVVHLIQLALIKYEKTWKSREANLNKIDTQVNSFPLYGCPDFGQNLFQVLPKYNESMMSLLFKLLKKYSRDGIDLDSFRDNMKANKLEEKFGDGEFYITKLLHNIASCSPLTTPFLQELENTISQLASFDSHENTASSSKHQDKQAIAKRRRAQLLKQFAKIRQDFIEKSELPLEDDKEMENIPTQEEFHCVICMEKGSSLETNPFGLVVSLTSSDILRHRQFEQDQKTHYYFRHETTRLFDKLQPNSDQFSLNTTFPLCQEGGGVHVRTCGHYLHMDCLNSYLDSLSRGDQVNRKSKGCQTIVEKFTCPMCRQVAHSFLPVLPSTFVEPKSPAGNQEHESNQILQLLKKRTKGMNRLSPKLTEAVCKFVMDLNKKLYGVHDNNEPFANEAHLLALHLQTNVEIELCIGSSEKLSEICFSSIPTMMQALQVQYKMLPAKQGKKLAQLWENIYSEKPVEGPKEIPLLLRNSFSILVHFVLQLGSQNMTENLFACLVQRLFELGVAQIVTSILWTSKCVDSKFDNFSASLCTLLDSIWIQSGENFVHKDLLLMNPKEIQDQVRIRISSFLKQACMLKHSLFGSSFGPDVCRFEDLVEYLRIELKSCPVEIIKIWCKDLFMNECDCVESLLLFQTSVWNAPNLIKLPVKFDELYQKIAKYKCNVCEKVPEHPGLCLLCGTIVCLGDNCCENKSNGIWEGVSHAKQCGSGNAIILCVTTSNIAVIGKKQACYWGSVYLDSFGEEDIGLKRGRPLYLCNDRYEFLQKEWIHFAFQKTFRRWFTHCDKL